MEIQKSIDKKVDFDELKRDILCCNFCEKKFGFKPNPIFWGNKQARIFHISQAPSNNVHITSKPFNDLSGKRLREWYQVTEDVFYNPNVFYITAIGHCFPGKDGKGGDIKPPKDCAQKWLVKELEAVDNNIYIIVGREAGTFLFPNKKYQELIFEDQVLNNKLALVLPHPSPLNARWFKNNPTFFKKRLPEIREHIIKNLS